MGPLTEGSLKDSFLPVHFFHLTKPKLQEE